MKADARFRQVRTNCCQNILTAALVAAAMLFAAPFADAQSTGGRIRGTVTDPSAGAVPGATVQLINEATHATREVQSGANGDYVFIEVPIGSYEIHVASQGFKKYTRKGIVLSLNEVLTLDLVLVVSGATEVVEVTGAPPSHHLPGRCGTARHHIRLRGTGSTESHCSIPHPRHSEEWRVRVRSWFVYE